MALHDFTMQQWWMESLTAKIIAFSLELPEFCFFFFHFFFFKRLSVERCQLHHHADRPLPQSRCEFSFQELRPKGTTEHKRKKMAELDQKCAHLLAIYFSLRSWRSKQIGKRPFWGGKILKNLFFGSATWKHSCVDLSSTPKTQFEFL